MKNKRTIFLLLAILTLTLTCWHSEAQLLDRVIKTKGGGGSDIVELISNIPGEAQIVLSVNWENLAKTDLIDIGKEAMGPDIQMIEEMGIDIKQDLKHLIFAVTFKEEPVFYGIIVGTFDSEKILKLAKDNEVEVEELKIGSKVAYGIEDIYLNFNDTGIFFAGSEGGGDEAIRKMLSVGDDNLADNKEMVALVKDADTSATAWGGFIIPAELREEMAEEGSEEIPFDPANLRMANFSMNYGKMIDVNAGVFFSDPDSANKLVDFVKQMISETKSSEEFPPDLQELIDKFKVSADGKVARGSISVEAEKLKELMEQFAPGMEEEWEEEVVEEEEEEVDDSDEWDDDDGDDDDIDDEKEKMIKDAEKLKKDIESGKIDINKLKGFGK